MTLVLNQADWNELLQQTPKPRYPDLVLDDFETLEGVPRCQGRGYTRSMELSAGVYLDLLHQEFYQNWTSIAPIREHSVEYSVWLSGSIHDKE